MSLVVLPVLLYGIGAAAAVTLNPVDIFREVVEQVTGDPTCDHTSVSYNGNRYWSTSCPPPFSIAPDQPLPTGGGSLVVFGDSFTAGEGAPQVLARKAKNTAREGFWAANDYYVDGTDTVENRCHQSPNSYGWRLAKSKNLTVDFRACSGATSRDYFNSQHDRFDADGHLIPAQNAAPLPRDTTAVLVGFGGNDAEFADLVTACLAQNIKQSPQAAGLAGRFPVQAAVVAYLTPGFDCVTGARDRQARLPELLGLTAPPSNTGTASHLDDPALEASGIGNTYAAIRRLTPTTIPVIAVSYPMMFPANPVRACGLGDGTGASLSIADQKAINEFETALNKSLQEQATQAGIHFVDLSEAFRQKGDHGMCVDAEPDADTRSGRYVNRFRLGQPVNSAVSMDGIYVNAAPSSFGEAFGLVKKSFPEMAESVHPNAVGQLVMAEAIRPCLDDQTACTNHAALQLQTTVRSFDWHTAAFAAGGCPSRQEWSEQSDAAWAEYAPRLQVQDVTGDGQSEVLASYRCFTTTSSNPDQVTVFSMTGTTPTPLATLGESYFRGATLSLGTTTIALEGPAVGDSDGLCCADHWAKEVYSWTGSRFELTEQEQALTSQPIVHEGLATGTYHGIIRAARDREVFVDEVQWFGADEAEQACTDDGVRVQDEAWCHAYYVRNMNDRVRAMAVTAGARVSYFDGNGSTVTISGDRLSALTDARVVNDTDTDSLAVFSFDVVDGVVTGMSQEFMS
ncbi:MAG: hydrolase family protein [Blastococcus sp.]|jgi:lysophospholipase L1-like esterase|nr:hydrolase family protein [Blastococcus sp.]